MVVGGSGFYLQALEHPPLATPTHFEATLSEGDYDSAKTYADKASKEYTELGDSDGIARCSALLDRLYKTPITEETKPQNIQGIMDSAKNINIFPILSVFLLIAIVLMLAERAH